MDFWFWRGANHSDTRRYREDLQHGEGQKYAFICARVSRPRMRLNVEVRCSTNPWRARCTISRLCCSKLLTGTKHMLGQATASQIAAASAASFLPRLPDNR